MQFSGRLFVSYKNYINDEAYITEKNRIPHQNKILHFFVLCVVAYLLIFYFFLSCLDNFLREFLIIFCFVLPRFFALYSCLIVPIVLWLKFLYVFFVYVFNVCGSK
jgi:hypothetical protein